MSDYVKNATSAADQYLNTLAEGQEKFLEAMAKMSEMAPKAPPVEMPAFATDLPTAKEISEANFAFATKLIKQQKAFTDKLFSTNKPASSSTK